MYGLFITGIVLILIWASVNRTKEGFANAATGPYTLRMYYADWCPHCHKAKPEFEKLGATKTIGGESVSFEAIDAEKEPDKVVGKVSGYPTVRLYDSKNRLVQEYEGERTEGGFLSFLQQHLSH